MSKKKYELILKPLSSVEFKPEKHYIHAYSRKQASFILFNKNPYVKSMIKRDIGCLEVVEIIEAKSTQGIELLNIHYEDILRYERENIII